MLQSHAGIGFHPGMRFQATAFFSSPLRSHMPLPRGGPWSSSPQETAASTPIRRSRRRQPSCRSYSSLFDSSDGASGGDEEKADGLPEGAPSSSSDGDGDSGGGGAAAVDGIGDVAEGNPEPRADEQITAPGATDPPVAAEGAAAAAGEEQQGDWDKAWASTRQRMEKEKKAAPAFSGRKQVVASKNADGGYDFQEISADGSSRMQGDKGSGGFGFADSSQVEDGPGRVRRQEQEAVNLATTNQVRFSPGPSGILRTSDLRADKETTTPKEG